MLQLGLSAPALAQNWEPIGDEDGIQVYQRAVPGQPVHAIRGTTVVDAPIAKILWVLSDHAHDREWVDRLKKTVVLERTSPFDFVVYQSFSSPPLTSDRDLVYRAKILLDSRTGVARVQSNSVTHSAAPPTIGVRARLVRGEYVLTPLEGGKKTRVEVQALMDPMGGVPKWIVNMVQKTWPINSLKALKAQVKKAHVKSYPLPV